MLEEIWDEAKDFFEDIFEHLFERDKEKRKDSQTVLSRTRSAYLFTERIDSLMKIVFGVSIFISALAASVWGFTAVGEMVKSLVESIPGRLILIIIGISYLVNGMWRLFHPKN